MGIKNFKNFLLSKINTPIQKISFNDAPNAIKSVCIDVNIFIYKYITAIRRTGKDLYRDGKITSHIIGFHNQINKFKKLGINIIYVFDGEPPKEKENVLKERYNIKKTAYKDYKKTKSIKSYQQSFYITDDIINDTIEYFKSMKISYIYQKDVEADLICASLVKQKIVDCAYSTDFDILVYGADYLIINMDYKKEYFEFISLKHILKELNIKYEQFVDIIVLSGCDYCNQICLTNCDKPFNITLNRAYNMIKENKGLNNIIKENNDVKKYEKNLLNAKKIFMKNLKIKKSWIN
jgi:flap endonuclease-1